MSNVFKFIFSYFDFCLSLFQCLDWRSIIQGCLQGTAAFPKRHFFTPWGYCSAWGWRRCSVPCLGMASVRLYTRRMDTRCTQLGAVPSRQRAAEACFLHRWETAITNQGVATQGSDGISVLTVKTTYRAGQEPLCGLWLRAMLEGPLQYMTDDWLDKLCFWSSAVYLCGILTMSANRLTQMRLNYWKWEFSV